MTAAANPGLFFGWRVVAGAFVLAAFGWGVGFYGPPVFLEVVARTRHWPLPEKHYGQECLVHAAKRPIDRDLDPDLADLCERRFGSGWRDRLPRGGFVGKLTLAGCLGGSFATPADRADEICGYFGPGRFIWEGTDKETFATAVPAIGRQGFWRVPRSLLIGEADG